MRRWDLGFCAVSSCLIAGLLAGCGGAQLPVGASAGMADVTHVGRAVMLNGVLITAAHPNLSAHRPLRSEPSRSMNNGFYQYIGDFGSGTILEFDYPKGDRSIGSINFTALGECTRTGKGTFWVATSTELAEFKVFGRSPIRTLQPGGVACAIDRATGDIATSALSTGGIIIFRHARGKGRVYGAGLTEAFFVGYDDRGNLFADGFNNSGGFGLAELPKGSSTFETITINNNVGFPGAVQWDGKYLTIGDQENHVIYRYAVSGTMATLKGTVSLSGSSDCDQTWIAKTIVFCPDAGKIDTTVYKYPAGGSAIATLTASFSEPLASVQVAK